MITESRRATPTNERDDDVPSNNVILMDRLLFFG